MSKQHKRTNGSATHEPHALAPQAMAAAPAPDAQQQVQINPVDAARFALQFLSRAHLTPPERNAYDIAEGMLKAIASGAVVLMQAPIAQPGVDTAPTLPPA